jgi:hypothetical protein
VYEKVILHLIPSALRRYRKNSLINYDKLLVLEHELPFKTAYRIKGVIIAFLRWPIHIARDVFHTFKNNDHNNNIFI